MPEPTRERNRARGDGLRIAFASSAALWVIVAIIVIAMTR